MIHIARVLLTGIVTLASPAASAPKPVSAGSYTDNKGAVHKWSVSPAHVLVWDGQPYVPVGGRFAPRYVGEGASEANWTKDVQDLAVLKEHRVLDLLIDPTGSAVDAAPSAWQRLVDHLEAQGFRYGVSAGVGIPTSPSGTVVKPASYRIPDVKDGTEVAWDVPDADSGRYVVVDARDATQVIREGLIRPRDGALRLTVDARSVDGGVAILYPHRTLAADGEGRLPDIWGAFDAYRDRMLAVLGSVKFGPGLRFFIDPLGRRAGLPGEADHLVPDGAAFRTEWEAYLSRRYPSLDDLQTAWGVLERSLSDHRQAAGVFPLWANNKGVPFLLDPQTGKRYQIAGNENRYWQDLRDCRDASLGQCMNAVADLLKREVANVPVVFTHTQQHRIFTNTSEAGGFDGVGMAAYGRGSALVSGSAASTYSQSEDSARTMWCIASETMDTSSPAKPQIGYASKQAMTYDLDWLRGIGARGFFVNGLRVAPEDKLPGFQIVRAPEQLDWLSEYAQRAVRDAATAGNPRVLLYPATAAGIVRSGPIGTGAVWWVPSLLPGKPVEFGTTYAGYTIAMPEGETLVMWSLRGARETEIHVTDPKTVTVVTADGVALPVRHDKKRHSMRFAIDENPVLIRSGGQRIFAIDALETLVDQLRQIVDEAQARKVPVQNAKHTLEAVVNQMRLRMYERAFELTAQSMNSLLDVMQPYAWREAELADTHTFSEVVPSEAASGGAYLALNTTSRPPREGYAAQMRFTVPNDDMYTVWAACTPPGPDSSAFAWLVDTLEPKQSAQALVVGSPYMGDRFAWLNLGRMPLKAGAHSLTIRVTDRAVGANRYLLSLDSIVVTRHNFAPKGTSKPPVTGQP